MNLHITDLRENKNLLYDPQYIVKYNKIYDTVTAISNLEIVDVIIAQPFKDIIMVIISIINMYNKFNILVLLLNILVLNFILL